MTIVEDSYVGSVHICLVLTQHSTTDSFLFRFTYYRKTCWVCFGSCIATTKCRNKRSKLQPFICFGRDWHTWTKLSPDHPAISWAPRTCEYVLLLELNLEATLKRGNNQCAKRLFIYACFDKGHCIYLSINQCRPKVDMCSSFNILDWIPLFEWCVVMYGSKNG